MTADEIIRTLPAYQTVLKHFNENHDPKNGQFAEGHGGFGSKSNSGNKSSNDANESESKNSTDVDDNRGNGVRFSDKQKKVMRIGAIAALTALAVIGGVTLAKRGKLDQAIDVGKKAIDRNVTSVEKIMETVKDINPSFNSMTDVPKSSLDGAPLNKVNCQACTLAYELKRRFGDSFAKSAKLIDTRQLGNIFEKIYDDENTEGGFALTSDLAETIRKLGDGARGNLTVQSQTLGGMHSIAFEVVNGKAMAFDCQSGVSFDLAGDAFRDVYGATDWTLYNRLDNAPLKDGIEELLDQLIDR